ncbi:TetR/AcrR family transcriptional regulator [Paenibacillus sp. CN-4]|uniref:TetR/AcrR family transcriptional regulator n=1 Tax=Paenibacillus nanchangensis TaxID=3348343 RepID=UPI00397A2CC3
MPKIGMEPRRRAELINATLTCISERGMEGMTLDKVAEYAGCSKGVVVYYFKNKDELTVEAFKAFMAYYGRKIESEIRPGMAAGEMLDIVLNQLLPPYREPSGRAINVSELEGAEQMAIPLEDQARLFVQFFSKAMTDPNIRNVAAESYPDNLRGIARIFEYGNQSGQMAVAEPADAAYGMLAMVIGLSFFRVAGVLPADAEDNRQIGENYVSRLTQTISGSDRNEEDKRK